jgi:hypothetical protein
MLNIITCYLVSVTAEPNLNSYIIQLPHLKHKNGGMNYIRLGSWSVFCQLSESLLNKIKNA